MKLKTKNITLTKKHSLVNLVFLLVISIGFTDSVRSQSKNLTSNTLTENKAVLKTDAEKNREYYLNYKASSFSSREEYSKMEALKTDAEKDWEYLEFMSRFYAPKEETRRVKKMDNIFESLKFSNKVYTNRSRLAKAFIEKYPNDPNYERALSFFFSTYFQPQFITEKITEEQRLFFSKFPRSYKDWNKIRRALPIDKAAKERWLKYGNELVAKILASNVSLERKAQASMALINRDFLLARDYYSYLQKEPEESDYWAYFDTYYWASFRQRLYSLIDTYPDSEDMARYVPAVLNGLKLWSPKLAKTYLKAFYIKTGNSNPLANRTSIKVLHKVLGYNLAALEAQEEADGNKPVGMALTAMDGKKIDLSKMRGKVVLIDFWSIRCGPCIKEMPHVQAMYDKYREQGFEVIGIVADGDESRETILKIQKRTGANWPQHLDKGKDATVNYHSLYNIISLPTVWLLDKDGVIVDRQARGERLEPLIRKYLGLD